MPARLLDRSTADEMKRRINAVPGDARPRWGRMSPAAMMYHVAHALKMNYGRAEVPDQTSLLNRVVVKRMLMLNFPWRMARGRAPAPKGVLTTAEGTFDEGRADLLAALDGYLDWLDANPDAPFRHPVLGTMTQKQVKRLNWQHLNHHLVQFGV